ncbi:MAG: response regulator [Nitrosopumilaceae archaeon]|nr:response regulator [Nitrosopumilaceae archaeon]
MKILGIDDNEEINKLLSTVIKSDGHEFTQVNSGRKGLELILQGGFDVVLLDVAMPEFSGKDVVNALIEKGKIKDTPIVLFTASSIVDEEIQELISKGVHSCIRKPAPIHEILNLLKTFQNN